MTMPFPLDRRYCSQQGSSSSFHTLKEGIEFIEAILQKKLCAFMMLHILAMRINALIS
ncbi:hypothetical protein [Rhabdochlamydiaceae symbiont of Dictyostelium giganteum]|uniref:hypothetical protein n=1 Tax=Rhabdochlamydiaceae symbiont of Dictyostelium giganteum TaxID=3342349 RepID=UPI00384FAFE8